MLVLGMLLGYIVLGLSQIFSLFVIYTYILYYNSIKLRKVKEYTNTNLLYIYIYIYISNAEKCYKILCL